MTATEPPEIPKTIVLVGLMGAGKTCIGARLAERLDLAFVDADLEIEMAAGCSIADIFELYGEDAFRDGERRVIARLLESPVHVLATGGGAFMDADTRALIARHATAIWLRADLDLLASRVGRRGNRPILRQGNKREIIEALMAERYPVYAEAHITVDSARESPDVTVARVMEALCAHLAGTRPTGNGTGETAP